MSMFSIKDIPILGNIVGIAEQIPIVGNIVGAVDSVVNGTVEAVFGKSTNIEEVANNVCRVIQLARDKQKQSGMSIPQSAINALNDLNKTCTNIQPGMPQDAYYTWADEFVKAIQATKRIPDEYLTIKLQGVPVNIRHFLEAMEKQVVQYMQKLIQRHKTRQGSMRAMSRARLAGYPRTAYRRGRFNGRRGGVKRTRKNTGRRGRSRKGTRRSTGTRRTRR